MKSSRQNLGHMPFSEFVDEQFWGSWAKSGLVNSNLKKQGFGELCGDLI